MCVPVQVAAFTFNCSSLSIGWLKFILLRLPAHAATGDVSVPQQAVEKPVQMKITALNIVGDSDYSFCYGYFMLWSCGKDFPN